jgi:hypothetical protein
VVLCIGKRDAKYLATLYTRADPYLTKSFVPAWLDTYFRLVEQSLLLQTNTKIGYIATREKSF